jgi:hypothetical protein
MKMATDPFIIQVDFNDGNPYWGRADPAIGPGDHVMVIDYDGSMRCPAIVVDAHWGLGDPTVWFVGCFADLDQLEYLNERPD